MSPVTSDTPFFQNPRFWRAVVILFLAVGFLRGFWDEVQLVWQYFFAWFVYIVIEPVQIPYGYDTQLALEIVGLNAAIFILGYMGVIAWMAQFTLPVQRLSDRLLASWRLFLYDLPFVRLHGPAVFVKGGKLTAAEEELDSTKPGVALVDLYSAIVVEHERGAKIRAAGAGITFTRGGEKIISSVDLRQQSRGRPNVSCNTGDGIEVTTKVSTKFTLGQPPEILPVTKIENNWVVAKIENTPEGNKIVTDFLDELENDDKEEIDQFLSTNNIEWIVGASGEKKGVGENLLPFAFDEKRVIKAVYSRARNVTGGGIGEWIELPVDVAVDIFRNKLAHEPYDDLYLPEDPDKYPMKNFKTRFETTVRNMGILGYSVVKREDGQPLELGKTYNDSELLFSSPRNFKRSTLLRDRGIKILSAGFSNLAPTTDVIEKRLLDHWRAHWQQEADKTTAELELQAMRIRNSEHAKAQQDMIYALSQIFQTEQYASEALAIRLYQALEMAASQPATQRLLPADTVEMLKNLKEWLLPDQKKEKPLGDEFLDGVEVG